MHRFIILLLGTISLLTTPISLALTISGKIHLERYTFFLNQKGGNDLRYINDKVVDMMESGRPGNVTDSLKIQPVQQKGYSLVGISPSPFMGNVRYDGLPVKAVTCLISTVPVSTRTVEQTYCKDETGAEYIGFKGWPLHGAIEKSCRVGDDDCPVYLTFQGDDPTVRDDSVQFVSKPVKVHPAAPEKLTNPVIVNQVIADLKANGCAIINKYKQSPPKCGSVIEVVTGNGMDRNGVRSYQIDYAAPGNSWREQWPVTLTYRDETLIRFKDGEPLEDPIDIENPANNKPSINSTQNGQWQMTRSASSMIFTTKNESGIQLELACGEDGDFAVRYGTEGNWTSSGPMSQLTLKVGSNEFSPDQAFFESLSNLPSSSKITVLQMGHEYGTFSVHGLPELLTGITWRQCLNPQSGI